MKSKSCIWQKFFMGLEQLERIYSSFRSSQILFEFYRIFLVTTWLFLSLEVISILEDVYNHFVSSIFPNSFYKNTTKYLNSKQNYVTISDAVFRHVQTHNFINFTCFINTIFIMIFSIQCLLHNLVNTFLNTQGIDWYVHLDLNISFRISLSDATMMKMMMMVCNWNWHKIKFLYRHSFNHIMIFGCEHLTSLTINTHKRSNFILFSLLQSTINVSLMAFHRVQVR